MPRKKDDTRAGVAHLTEHPEDEEHLRERSGADAQDVPDEAPAEQPAEEKPAPPPDAYVPAPEPDASQGEAPAGEFGFPEVLDNTWTVFAPKQRLAVKQAEVDTRIGGKTVKAGDFAVRYSDGNEGSLTYDELLADYEPAKR